MRTTSRLCPADSLDGRIYGLLCPSSSQIHFLWVDHSACPCFIDPTPRKFTTSAFPVHRLTGERFSAGMRSDGGRESARAGSGKWNEKERQAKGMLPLAM